MFLKGSVLLRIPSVLILSSLALAACVPVAKVEQPPVTVGYAKGFNTGRVASQQTVTLRTFSGEGKDKKEVLGASCMLQSEELSGKAVTPAHLVVPRLVQSPRLKDRGRPTPLRAECKHDGMTGVESFNATDKRVGTATNAGIAGAILTTVVTAAIASSTPWEYPGALHVTLVPPAK